jgi:hypothetical protein
MQNMVKSFNEYDDHPHYDHPNLIVHGELKYENQTSSTTTIHKRKFALIKKKLENSEYAKKPQE